MRLLAIETATEACSAALGVGGEILSRFELAARRHTELILPMCETLLRQAGIALADLDAVAFGCGPGSFTGLRIAAGVAQGIAFARDLPVVPVSTLAVLAQGAMARHGATHVLAAIDARMEEVYWAQYVRDSQGLARLQGAQQLLRPGSITPPARGLWYGAGSGWQAYGGELAAGLGGRLRGCDPGALPDARDLIPLAEQRYREGAAVAAEAALPVYLRDRVARKRQGQGGRGLPPSR
jgi:tRNA threonylcarbamoyladenosine biosynthesis protein TsaB